MGLKRYSIHDMQRMAKKRNGECLSRAYRGSQSRLRWKCEMGHEWMAVPNSVMQGTWCGQCVKRGPNARFTLERMQSEAKKRGGSCLSKRYKNVKSKLLWVCEKGHRWNATPGNVLRGNWCPQCGNRKPFSLQILKQYAQAKGGTCLSTDATSYHDRIEWECREGHRWSSIALNTYYKNQWCKQCSKSPRLNLSDLRQDARDRGGKCLARRYISSTAPVHWQCDQGHRFWMTPNAIRSGGQWCHQCRGIKVYSISDMREMAKARGGRCISRSYNGSATKLEWECGNGNRFHKMPGKIVQNQWCPRCYRNTYEEICRIHFETIFNSEFPNSRPPWLRYVNGRPLELDGYSEDLGIAFEHQGSQHYNLSLSHITDTEILKEQKKRDRFKKRACKKMGVRLFVIPELVAMTSIEDLPIVIQSEGERLAVALPKDILSRRFDFSSAFRSRYVLELQSLAFERGGKLLSKSYEGAAKKLGWQYAKKHKFECSPNNVKNGKWCARCARDRRRNTIEDMHALAAKRQGRCTSKKYVNSSTHLTWECELGPKWRAAPTSITSGTWCRKCVQPHKSNPVSYKGFLYPSRSDLADAYGISRKVLHYRLSVGWTVDDAIQTPVQRRNKPRNHR